MADDTPRLVPVRMLNEFAYCPRLFYLEWVQGEWADNLFTEHGRLTHRRADKPGGEVPAPESDTPFVARSVSAAAPRIGLTTKVDVLEGDGGEVVPVEYKRGRPAPVPEQVYEPERVQVCAQGLVLRENGYPVTHGEIYFAQTRERVEVPFDEALVARTLELLEALRRCADEGEIPGPLDDSPKCIGCSLNAICLPDEVHLLQGGAPAQPRQLTPARDDALPLYVQEQGARVGIDGDCLAVRDRAKHKIAEARLLETSQVCVYGNVQVSTQALRRLASEGMPVSLFSYGGWFYGRLVGNGHKNIEVRRAQFRAADSDRVVPALRAAHRAGEDRQQPDDDPSQPPGATAAGARRPEGRA